MLGPPSLSFTLLARFKRIVKIRTSILLAAVLFALLCSGCIPIRYTARPGASGVVLDAHTGVPISHAAVSVAHIRGDDPAGIATTIADGSFQVPPRRLWGVIFIFPGDIFPFPYSLSVQHDGYQSRTIQFARRALGEGTSTNFGVLRLERITQ